MGVRTAHCWKKVRQMSVFQLDNRSPTIAHQSALISSIHRRNSDRLFRDTPPEILIIPIYPRKLKKSSARREGASLQRY